MRFLFKALLAATALVPLAAAASAQGAPDGERGRGRWADRTPDGGDAAQRERPRGDRDGRGERPGGATPGWDRGDRAGTERPGDGSATASPRPEPGQRRWSGRGDVQPSNGIDPPPPRQEAVGRRPRVGDWNRAQVDPGRGDDRSADRARNDPRFGDGRGDRQRDGRGYDGRGYDGRGYDDRGRRDAGWRDDGRGVGGGDWNRTWRNDRRYDWTRYRSDNRGAYRLPRYYAPSGWNGGYRRFALGATLGASLWDRRYWIADPYAYRLPDAYGPYRWVRYYDDALLVDLRSGRVIDTVYGIFW